MFLNSFSVNLSQKSKSCLIEMFFLIQNINLFHNERYIKELKNIGKLPNL